MTNATTKTEYVVEIIDWSRPSDEDGTHRFYTLDTDIFHKLLGYRDRGTFDVAIQEGLETALADCPCYLGFGKGSLSYKEILAEMRQNPKRYTEILIGLNPDQRQNVVARAVKIYGREISYNSFLRIDCKLHNNSF